MGRGAEKQKRIRELINLMQRNPYLWNHHLPHYTTNKNRALEAAAKQLGEADEDVAVTVKSLKDTYRKEKRKKEKAARSGAVDDGVFTPGNKWRWFKDLDSFMQPLLYKGRGKFTPRTRTEPICIINGEMTVENIAEAEATLTAAESLLTVPENNTTLAVETPVDSPVEPPIEAPVVTLVEPPPKPLLRPTTRKQKFASTKCSESQVIIPRPLDPADVAPVLANQASVPAKNKRDDIDAFSELISHRIRRLPEDQRDELMDDIWNLIFTKRKNL